MLEAWSYLTQSDLLHPLILLCLPWITYYSAIKGTFVSDDVAGIAVFDGKLQTPLSFHNLFKQFRYYFGRKPNPDYLKWIDEKDHKKGKHERQWIACNKAHHRLSLYICSLTGVLLYLVLSLIIGPHLAFLSTVLFLVHPLGAQVIAWISGVGYLLGFTFSLGALYLVQTGYALHWVDSTWGFFFLLGGFSVLQWLAVEAIFPSVGTTLILAFLGYWPFALLSGLISLAGAAGTLKSAVSLRKQAFEEQKMGRSTKFTWRKGIVAMKSLQYYVKLCFLPRSMGLYHTYMYHYPIPEVEQPDKDFLLGLGILLTGIAAFFLAPAPVCLALVWFIAYLFIFLNWVTAHQFVSERYAWMPTVGVCILLAWALSPWPWAFALLTGLALCRTWVHIPTYYDEVMFYQSNIWNFFKSEVAFGNLGVVYTNHGLVGSSIDMWSMGSKINPEYDVNWYNLYSVYKTQAVNQKNRELLQLSRDYLLKAINAKSCHFPDRWQEELKQVDLALGLVKPEPILIPGAKLIRMEGERQIKMELPA